MSRYGRLRAGLQGPAALRCLHNFHPNGGCQMAKHQHRDMDDSPLENEFRLASCEAQTCLHDLAIAKTEFLRYRCGDG